MVWSQSTVRGKLSLGKERKWDIERRTHRETHCVTEGEIFGQKHEVVYGGVHRLTGEITKEQGSLTKVETQSEKIHIRRSG